MATVWTKEAADIFAALDGSLKPRMIDAAETATWGSEVEAAINALEARIGTGGLLTPTTNDSAALGSAALQWSDLFLASGAVVNFNAGNLTITHAANALYFAGGSSGYFFDAAPRPTTNDAAALGTSAVAWSDLFLASGAVVNFGAGDVTITHAANTLTIDGAASGVRANDPFTACADDAIPAGGTAGLGLMFSATANFGIFFGSGAPTLSAAKGSLYMRSDGSSTSTRAYVNTNGSTTWASLTASA